MTDARRHSNPPRRGLVLGGGGPLGAAWTVGALTAIEESTGTDLRDVDHVVGTSAGAVTAALLGAGVSVHDLREHQRGNEVDGPLSRYQWDYDSATGGARPPMPRLGMGSPRMVARNVTRLRKMPPTAVFSALLPQGRGTLRSVSELIDTVYPSRQWPAHPNVWVVAMDYESGRRVAFGRADAPETDLPTAVMASCAVPGWFAPVPIGGRRYVDGGACSATSVDLLAGLGLDEVFVVAPAVSFESDRPRAVLPRLERTWRKRVTRRCMHEVGKLHADGARVTVLAPGPADLVAMGGNMMDTIRRRRVLETSLQTSAEALGARRDAA
ncbi:patatin-like phospholipase family protein [Actinobacteria bacterium YIM 96077]|uniref:Patatin-like phospholipase family protein n=1 Tax=Phytoactinopolyspora halophila TaxID=1981511 RepID=A0A329R289_9ACTN|nr:patatin-like phospholipase family protein [Phytoactinopolyspora halophila]AYY12076.1 patatin-like phospholipase family protein [Actinobacteria bacterium YIM 96077]RAW18690.1 patatin-like phospholipase family protein [Phytoactinopolyspora halophila]